MKQFLALCLLLLGSHFAHAQSCAVLSGGNVIVTSGGVPCKTFAVPTPNPPAEAVAAGYTTLTFDSSAIGNVTGELWAPVCLNGACNTGATQNVDGSVTLAPTISNNGVLLGTAHLHSSVFTTPPYEFDGIAFGCGAEFELTAYWTGDGSFSQGAVPSFWAVDAETQSTSSTSSANIWGGGVNPLIATLTNGNANISLPFDPTNVFATTSGQTVVNSHTYIYDAIQFATTVGNLTGGTTYHVVSKTTSSVQVSATSGGSAITPSASGSSNLNYYLWPEFDIIEDDIGTPTGLGSPDASWAWNNLIGNASTTHTTWSGQTVVAGFKFAPHKYAGLWIPAVGGTPGSLQWYVDGVLSAGDTQNYNLYSTATPPTPVYGTSAMSVIDQRHMIPIVSTVVEHPMIVKHLRIWQNSSACNIVH